MTSCTKWGQAIRDRDQVCQIGKALRYEMLMSECHGAFEAHHLVGRGNKHLRNNPDNGILLCEFHHKHCRKFAPHKTRKGFERFLKAYMPLKWKFLKDNKHKIFKQEVFNEKEGIRKRT